MRALSSFALRLPDLAANYDNRELLTVTQGHSPPFSSTSLAW